MYNCIEPPPGKSTGYDAVNMISPEESPTMNKEKLAADIEKTVNAAYKELGGLSGETVKRKSYPDEWSIKEIIGHLVDSASNNHQRWVRRQIADDPIFPDYQNDNERWVRIQQCNNQDWKALLELWRLFNLHLSTMVRNVNTGSSRP